MLNALTKLVYSSAVTRRLTRNVARGAAELSITKPFILALKSRIIDVNNEPVGNGKGDGRPVLLALQPIRFRGELELCDARSPYRILIMPLDWQERILALFYEGSLDKQKILANEPVEEVKTAQRAARRFLRTLITDLYAELNIVGTLSAGAHYWRDLDWGVAGKQAGFPFIILHRENLYPREAHKDILQQRFGWRKPFEGDAIITHNESTRQGMLKAKFCRPDQIHSLGAMRMDDYIRRLKDERANTTVRERPLVVLFSFLEGVGMTHLMPLWSDGGTAGWAKLFDATHNAMVLLANKRPDIDVVIKFKVDSYIEKRFAMARARQGLPEALPNNLTTTQVGDAQELIVNSSVVVAFGSTTVLEAAIAGKPVILPLLEEAGEGSEFAQYAHFADRPELFDVACSQDEIIRHVEHRLEHPEIDDDCMRRREETFEEFVSSLDPRAVDRYVEFLTANIGHVPADDRAA